MIGTYLLPTPLEVNINNSFKLYKKSIVDNFLAQIKQEQLKGESCLHYKSFNVWLAIYLVTLVYLDIIKYPNKDWNYFYKKYDLDSLKKCLLCNEINLDDILDSFGLKNFGKEYGINFIGIEKTFEVEPSPLSSITTIIKVNITDILQNTNSCINNII